MTNSEIQNGLSTFFITKRWCRDTYQTIIVIKYNTEFYLQIHLYIELGKIYVPSAMRKIKQKNSSFIIVV